MTKQELISKYGGTTKDWRKVGKAWVYKNVVIPADSTAQFLGEAIIEGGTIRGGTIWGGTIEGGTIWGGTISGGTIRGGTIWGGTIEGGTIWGGTIKGGTIDRTPSVVLSRYEITPTKPGYMQVGCEVQTYEDWLSKGSAIAAQHTKEDAEWFERVAKPMLPALIEDAKDLFKGQEVSK